MTNYIKLNGEKIELTDAQVEDLKRLLNGPIIFRGARGSGKTFYVAEKIKSQVKEIRAKAIKEFAEFMKNKATAIHKSIDGNYLYEISNNFIDNLVKEMVGDVE